MNCRTEKKLWAGLVAAFVVAACSDSTAPPTPTVVSISGSSSQLSHAGATLQFSAVVTDQHGAVMAEAPVAWNSSGSDVATVSASGLVTARGSGSAQITASAGSASDVRTVTVTLVPASIELLAGADQIGVVAEPLPDSIRVLVRDSGGTPIPGSAVEVTVEGGGSVSPASGTTDASGGFAARWTVGTDSRETYRATFRAGSMSAVVTATARPGSPAEIAIVAGDGQEAWAGDPLDEPLVVRIEDAFGNGVPSVPVSWSTAPGHGSLTPDEPISDSMGTARASWMAGNALGPSQATATAAGLPARAFTASVNPNAVISGRVSSTGAWRAPGPMAFGWEGSPAESRGIAAPAMSSGADDEIPREYLVRLEAGAGDPVSAARDGMSVQEARAIDSSMREALGGSVAMFGGVPAWEILDVSPALGIARVRIADGVSEGDALADLGANPAVREIESNRRWYGIEPIRSRDPAAMQLADLPRDGAGGAGFRVAALVGSSEPPLEPSGDPLWPLFAWNYKMVWAWDAWRQTRGSGSVIVAVVDDGIRTDHPEMQGRLLPGYSFVGSDPIPLCAGGTVPADGHGLGPGPDPNTPRRYRMSTTNCVLGDADYGGHGLHVAGTIAGNADNGYGGSGVAPGVSIMPVRVLGSDGSGSVFDIADGIMYAAGYPVSDRRGDYVQAPRRADIINLSLGGRNPHVATQVAVALAEQRGLLLVAAAGNSALAEVGYPAAYPEVIAVSALAPNEDLAWYSNHGPEIELWDCPDFRVKGHEVDSEKRRPHG